MPAAKLDQLLNWVSELITAQAMLRNTAAVRQDPGAFAVAEHIESIANNLRDTVFSMSMVPISSLGVRFRRLVRDLSDQLGKKVVFEAHGGDTVLDKNIIEQLAEPLLHILRNAIDHGIERPGDRVAKGKEAIGKITMDAYYEGAGIYIEIKDDGQGIDRLAVLQKAREKGLVPVGADLSDEEILRLLFAPGFSTAGHVTDISGRGVGMDVVRKKIEELRGKVTLESVQGHGTTLRIRLPMSLSIIQGLLTEVSGHCYIFPLTSVQHCHRVTAQEVQKARTVNHSLLIENRQLSFLSLRSAFAIEGKPPEKQTAVTVFHNGIEKCLVVDNVVEEGQYVLKSLGKMYNDQEFVSGASILGNGMLALILDTDKLFEAGQASPAPAR